MDGSEVRTVREGMKMSRGEFATKAGLSIGRLAAIELGHGKPPTPHEIAGLAGAALGVTPEGHTALQDLASAAVVRGEAGDSGVLPEQSDLHPNESSASPRTRTKAQEESAIAVAAKFAEIRAVDLEEWCGLKSGDSIRAIGKPKALLVFKRYIETRKSGHRYVEAFGGIKGHSMFHALRPERVLTMGGQPVEQLFLTGEAPVIDPDNVKPQTAEDVVLAGSEDV